MEKIKEDQPVGEPPITGQNTNQPHSEEPSEKPNLANQSSDQIPGEQPIEERITELESSLKRVSNIFNSHRKLLKGRLHTWIIFTALLAFALVGYYIHLLNYTYPDWTWKFGYTTVVRVTAMTALFSLFAFCLKMVRSYLYMYEHTLHKKAVIDSMASFVSSAIGKDNRGVIYSKLIHIVVEMGNTGLISKEGDFKYNGASSEVLEVLLSKMKE
ncbi:MAG TPA: hypothetical protein VN698_01720 [Bacteroidia bacterium]|nr:hypothetical protein [Bacteroidia bacterium]